MKLVLAFLSLVGFSSAFAIGHDIGNGGDVVVCYKDDKVTKKSVELLDFYEARELRNIPVLMGGPELSMDQKIGMALARLRVINPTRANRLRAYAKTAMNEVLFKRGKNLVDIPDSGHLFLDENCKIKQIAIQETPRFPGDPRYLIDEDLWNLLDEDGKAGLVLHEVIWRELRLAGVKNSVPVRYLNSLMFGDRLNGLSVSGYVSLAVAMGLPDFDAEGLVLALCKPTGPDSPCGAPETPVFRKDGRLWAGFVVPPSPPWDENLKVQTYNWRGQNIRVAGPILFGTAENEKAPLIALRLSPYSGGVLQVGEQSVKYTGYQWGRGKCGADWSCAQYLEKNPGRILFSPAGELKSLKSPSCEGILNLKVDGTVESCDSKL